MGDEPVEVGQVEPFLLCRTPCTQAAYERSIALLARVRPRARTGFEDARAAFRNGRGGVFYSLVDLLLRFDPEATPAAERDARMRRAREVVEALKKHVAALPPSDQQAISPI